MKDLPPYIDKQEFVELIRENVNFPQEAGDYLVNIFFNPLDKKDDITEIIKSAGQEFYIKACDTLLSGLSGWNEITQEIGKRSGKKGKELFMPLRAAITGQTKGPELDKVVEFLGTERVVERLKEASKL